ncbi:MAG: sensor histidine kinase [Solirubrobacteraceae bacterium]
MAPRPTGPYAARIALVVDTPRPSRVSRLWAAWTAPSAPPPPRSRRDWSVDVVLFLCAVGFGAYSFVTTYDHGADRALLATVDVIVGAVMCLALWWRRRWPVALALVHVVIGTFGSAAAGSGVVAIFTLAVHREAAITLTVTALTMASAFAYIEVHPDPEVPYLASVITIVTVLGMLAAWGMFIRARRQLVASLRGRVERAEAEQELRADGARADERARIAREMHDVLAHRISLLSMHAGALEFRRDATPDEVARAAGVIRQSAHQALEDLRGVIGVLRDRDMDDPTRPQPTVRDLPALLEESRATGTRVHDRIAVARIDDVPDALGRNAYRIVQEGLTNARKHATGTTVTVTLEGGPDDGLIVAVANPAPVRPPDGPPLPGAGTGIVGLGERVVLAGGRLEHGPTPDGGFRLRAWLPWPE